jgi:DNA-binding NtrC family response regulator/tetratricopeptide (TPR) repeat protein
MERSDRQSHTSESSGLLSSDASGLARVYLRCGSYADAERLARQSIGCAQGPCPEASVVLLVSLMKQGRTEEARALRASMDDPVREDLRSELRLADAQMLISEGKLQACIDSYGSLVEATAQHVSDLRLRGLLALCNARLNDPRLARKRLEQNAQEASCRGWSEDIADSLMDLALLDRTEGHWSRADGLLLQARETYRSLGSSRKYIKATLNLGLQRLWRGHLTFAEEALREAVRLSMETADVAIEATARADRGLALVRLGRTAEARIEFAKSLRLCRRQASPRRTAIALEYTGELHLASQNYNRATSALRRSLTIANRIAPDGDIVPEVLRRQAEVALALGDTSLALSIARDAETRAERYGDRYERATALRVQAQVLYATGKETPGEELLRSALQILEELGETFERDRILAILGELEDDPTEAALSSAVPATLSTTPTSRSSTHSRRNVLELARRHGLFGSSRRLLDVVQQASQVASLEIPVLIQGETGTGKELLAQAIHRMGQWSSGPMVAFNCATCPADLLDSELFGHTRGAFTGAATNRDGLVRSAEGGTLFLDEIGELREESQARLLRFLDSGEVRSLGSDETRRVRVRILAATHVDLEDRILRKRFRRDLYYRLTGLRLTLPPLRDRRSDIRELIARFTDEARRTIRPDFAGLGRDAIAAMELAPWPGNVRQLKSEILRLAALATSGVPIGGWAPPDSPRLLIPREEIKDPEAVLSDPSRLAALLERCDGRVADVATALRVSRGHIYRVMKNHGIKAKTYQADR